MKPRPIHEAGRASTPLELLFDLVFVVAVGSAVKQLADGLAQGLTARSLLSFAMVSFAIWWAWMNFTWFASSYDVDDGPYRLMVMAQMVGVLILAAGLVRAFAHLDWTAGTIGYVVMRIAQIGQWVRAGRGDPDRRTTTRRYAVGIAMVQAGWLIRLAIPHTLAWTMASFAVLALAELAVPAVAEQSSQTRWHPHHIAERYGLFTLILLGELVAVAVAGVQVELDSAGLTPELSGVSAASLVLLFALWWLYFISPMAQDLTEHRDLAFAWGYGHASVFLALAVLGAGLDLAVQASHVNTLPVTAVTVGYLVCGPTALFIVGLWGLQAWARRSWQGWRAVATALIALVAAPFLGLSPLGPVGPVGASALVAAGLTATVMIRSAAAGQTETDHQDLVDYPDRSMDSCPSGPGEGAGGRASAAPDPSPSDGPDPGPAAPSAG
ncbi:MAG: low temperature requirement protein A [Bifidobacteriaceae bacterium]|jgi:low temperature requirement protein LtrA|nr:low temperature requirement protein A [Bifidobacteriaceae bacterium]